MSKAYTAGGKDWEQSCRGWGSTIYGKQLFRVKNIITALGLKWHPEVMEQR